MRLHETVKDARAKRAFEKLESRLLEIHEYKYSYNNSVYINARTPFKVTCPIHGDWELTPDNHKRGNGCPKCEGSAKLTTTEFIEKATIVHKNKYSYDNVIYSTSHEKVSITCATHGDFIQLANTHMCGKGCPKCANERKKNEYNGKFFEGQKAILYYAEIIPGVFKVGITTKTAKERLRRIKSVNVIYEVFYNDGKQAYETEQKILNKITTNNVASLLPIKFPGYTEMSSAPFYLTFMEEVLSSNYSKVTWSETH